ncbi:hypothetical protein BR93DRAFT_191859 [Coniochaeta sp. PMI_546]|nr:hypothetical protein BR93DRAFT_191859 [Coniochaeta sp. PMI_546]
MTRRRLKEQKGSFLRHNANAMASRIPWRPCKRRSVSTVKICWSREILTMCTFTPPRKRKRPLLISSREELFQDFAHKCHRVLMECFCYCDAPPQNITPLETYLENCDGRLATTTIPLSRLTSRPAKLMRCAAAELVVINAMVKHIFTDVYVPGAGTRQSAVSATLELLSRNPQRAAIVRCQLLAEFEIQSETFHSVAQAASNEVYAALDSLFPAGDPRQTFQTKLAELLKDAFKLWQNVQTSSERVVAKLAFDAQIADRMEDSYSDYDAGSAGEAGTPGSPTSTGVPAVQILFPMIRMGGETIFNPKVLWSDQAAFVEAGNELAAGNRTSICGSGIGASDATRQQVPRRRNSIRATQMPVARALQPPGPAVNTNVPSSHQIPGPNRGSENGIKATGGNR